MNKGGKDPRSVGIDVSAAAKAHRTGVGRYIVELVGALAQLDTTCRFDLLYRPSRWKQRRYFMPPPDRRFRTRPLLESFPFDRIGGTDVAHGTDGRLPRRRRGRLVATLHDMFSADSESFAGADFRAKKISRYEDVARRADLVIAVSEYCRSRIVAQTNVDPSRIRVIPHGVDARFGREDPRQAAEVMARYGLGKVPYFLYVGQLSQRKNLGRMLEAFSRMRDDVVLVLAGPASVGYEEIQTAHQRLGLGSRARFLGPVPDADLPALYQGAAVHLLVSLDEGFGLPVLEAFVAGTPVIASNRGALPEVAGDAARLVDPMDVNGITDAMELLLDDNELAESLRERGRVRAESFTWREAAERTMDIYREVARG